MEWVGPIWSGGRAAAPTSTFTTIINTISYTHLGVQRRHERAATSTFTTTITTTTTIIIIIIILRIITPPNIHTCNLYLGVQRRHERAAAGDSFGGVERPSDVRGGAVSIYACVNGLVW